MCRSMGLLLFVASFNFSAAEGGDNNDLDLTRQTNALLEEMKPGIPDLVKPLDPLHEDKISGEAPGMKYELNNVTLSGMKDCRVELFQLNPNDLTFLYILNSPRFVITSNYKVSGTLDSHPIDHEGSCQTIFDDYSITFRGKDTQTVDNKENKLRTYVDEYRVVDESIARVTVNGTSVRPEDEQKADSVMAYFEVIWGSANRATPNPLMEVFWTNYMHELNVYLKQTTLENIIQEAWIVIEQ